MIFKRQSFYAKQRAAIYDERRYSLIEASTKAGKTSGCILWLSELAYTAGRPGWNFWWVAPVSAQAMIAFRRMMRALPREKFTANLSDKVITTNKGTHIFFKSGDKPDSLYGEDVYAAVVDEASRIKEDSWHAIRSTLTFTRGPVRIIGNVKGRKTWFYQMARKAEKGDPEMGYHKLTAYDAVAAGVLARSEIDDAERTLPPHVFRELYLAEPAADGGNPFGGDDVIDSRLCELSTKPPIVWGWDLAKHVDWTVGIALDEDGKVCRFARFQLPWGETIARIRRETRHVNALVDSTGVGDPIVEELQRGSRNYEGYNFNPSSKQKLMEGLAAAIQSNTIGYPDGPIPMELKTFEYEYCLAPTTKVLTGDLRWVEVGSIRIGDEVLAFDEYPQEGEASRKWQRARVTSAAEIIRPCYRLILSDGTEFIASAEHRWLTAHAAGRGRYDWRQTNELRPISARDKSPRFSASKLTRLLRPWNEDASYEAGYLAGIFDGEGWLINQDLKARGYPGRRFGLGFAQRENEVAHRSREILTRYGFSWSEGRGAVIQFTINGGLPEYLRLLGLIRPARLLSKFANATFGRMEAIEQPTLVALECIGEYPVTALGTTTGTIVAEGIATHNSAFGVRYSAQEGFDDDCVMALALAVYHKAHAPSLFRFGSDEDVARIARARDTRSSYG